MWKSFCQNPHDSAIYLKVDIFDKFKLSPKTPEEQLIYRISVTNYVKLWTGVFDYDRIIKIMLESNKHVEIEDEPSFLHAGLRMLHNPRLVDRKEFTELDTGDLSVKLVCLGPTNLQMLFSLKVASADNFFYSVIRPLLMIVYDQANSEDMLRLFLIIKDLETKSFFNNLPHNSPLALHSQRTNVYNDTEHLERHNVMAKLLGHYSNLGVTPEQILIGNPLPLRPYDSERRRPFVPIVLDPRTAITEELRPRTLNIRGVPIHSGRPVPSLELRLPTVTNMTDQINAVNSEPSDGSRGPNAGTGEPNDNASEPNDGTVEPNDGTV